MRMQKKSVLLFCLIRSFDGHMTFLQRRMYVTSALHRRCFRAASALMDQLSGLLRLHLWSVVFKTDGPTRMNNLVKRFRFSKNQ